MGAAQAKPGFHGGDLMVMLAGVPNERSYGKTHYPHFDIQDLGTSVHGEIPPKTIKIFESITVKEPKPYPVHVPQPVPYPVHVPKPYPVPVTKIVHVPHTVPVEVIKPVHVPVEVPKPYPVPSHEFHGHSQGGHSDGGHLGGHLGGGDLGGHLGGHLEGGHLGGGGGFEGHFGGHLGGGGGGGGGDWASAHALHGESSHENFESYGHGLGAFAGGHEGEADQSAGYPAVAPAESQDQGVQEVEAEQKE